MKALPKVFICHSLFYAFIDRSHPNQQRAEAYFRHFAEGGYAIYTNETNLTTCYNNIRRYMSPVVANEFLRASIWGNLQILTPTDSELKEALKILQNAQLKEVIFQNAMVSVMAHKHNIPHIATFDPFKPYYGQKIFSLPK